MLWLDESEEEVLGVVRCLFGEVPRVFVDALGRITDDGDPSRMLHRMWREESGVMVKWLRPGPGLLAHVDSTDSLTQFMADHHWTTLDGDMA